MTRNQKKAIDRLNQFKKINLLYGNKLGITIEGVKQLQNDIYEALSLLQEQEKEIEKYKKLYQKALDDAVVTAHDNMQKDKIIDELAKAFKQDDVRSVQEIKQYFERKVEN